MNPENLQAEEGQKNNLFKVTPVSKYLAMALFVVLPFLGGWIGYVYAPDKVVEVAVEVPIQKDLTQQEIKELYVNEVGDVFAIDFAEPLVLRGVVRNVAMFDNELLIDLDSSSIGALPARVPRAETGTKTMVFSKNQQIFDEIEADYADGTLVEFTLADYHYDTRHIGTYDSGMLIHIEEIETSPATASQTLIDLSTLSKEVAVMSHCSRVDSTFKVQFKSRSVSELQFQLFDSTTSSNGQKIFDRQYVLDAGSPGVMTDQSIIVKHDFSAYPYSDKPLMKAVFVDAESGLNLGSTTFELTFLPTSFGDC